MTAGKHRATGKPAKLGGGGSGGDGGPAPPPPLPPLQWRYVEAAPGEVLGELLIVVWLFSVAVVQHMCACGGSLANTSVELVRGGRRGGLGGLDQAASPTSASLIRQCA